MTTRSLAFAAPGWYGKIPALGDFVARRLPHQFIARWDDWLSAELSDAQAVLGDTWVTTWQHAGISCFVLGAGVVDENTWQGILMPSVDRVGRRFPLTIAQLRPDSPAMAGISPDWAPLIQAARLSQMPECTADVLDQTLARSIASITADQPIASGVSQWGYWSDAAATVENLRLVTALPCGKLFRQLLSTTL